LEEGGDKKKGKGKESKKPEEEDEWMKKKKMMGLDEGQKVKNEVKDENDDGSNLGKIKIGVQP